jgi:hypothetical protein
MRHFRIVCRASYELRKLPAQIWLGVSCVKCAEVAFAGSRCVRPRPGAELRPTICRITDRSVRVRVCIISRVLRMSGSAVSQTLTGEFIPRPGLPGSGSW